MEYLAPAIPEVIIGLDLETQSLKPNAYVVSMAANGFDVRTLTHILDFYGKVDPKDPAAEACFHIDPKTVEWWEGKGDPNYAPDPAAFREAFSGTEKIPDVLKKLVDYLEPVKKKDFVITTRGPEFDIPIIVNALNECNSYRGVFHRHSLNDSDRTAERVLEALGLNIDYNVEKYIWCKTKDYIAHHPSFDSTLSAYRTARMYHLLYLIRYHGYDVASKANEKMRSGQYNAKAFLKEIGDE